MYALAIDIGASSGRHILSHLEDGKMILEEVYRFDNSQVVKDGHDCWDVEALFAHIVAGIKAAGATGHIPATIGIDTWGVDFVLLDKDNRPCSDAVAYRDKRTEGADAIVEAAIPPAELYAKAGIQKTPFNTIYQLAALKKEHPEQLSAAERLLMVPDYLNFRLTGRLANEYTDASTTGMLDAAKMDWDRDIIRRLGLPEKIFQPLTMPGAVLGGLLPEIQAEVGFDAKVVLPATHDTGSAYLAVPARDDKAVYLSSGTWSLLGVENDAPILSEASRVANFTNEGGAWGRFRYLKNIMGLWMIQSIRRELNGVAYVAGKENAKVPLTDWEAGRKYSFADLEAAAKASAFMGVVDVTDNRFLSPASMIAEVRNACAESEGGCVIAQDSQNLGQNEQNRRDSNSVDSCTDSVNPVKSGAVPETIGDVMQCVYLSLAKCYAGAVATLASLTGKTYTSLNIVGGGSKDGYLNALTARATGLEVFAGPTEGTAIGNLIIQYIAQGAFRDLAEARRSVAASFDVKKVS